MFMSDTQAFTPPKYFQTVCEATFLGLETAGVTYAVLSTGGGAALTTAQAASAAGGAAALYLVAKAENTLICTDIISSSAVDVSGGLIGTSIVTSTVSEGSISGTVTTDALDQDQIVNINLSGSGWTLDSQVQQNDGNVVVDTNVGYNSGGNQQTLSVTVTTDSDGNITTQVNGAQINAPVSVGMDNGGTIEVFPNGLVIISTPDSNGGVSGANIDNTGTLTGQSSSGSSFSIDGTTGQISDDSSGQNDDGSGQNDDNNSGQTDPNPAGG
jgi:hypothetical protein